MLFILQQTWKICSSFLNTLATCLRSFFLIQLCTFKFLLSRSKLIQRLPGVTHRLLYFEVCWKLSNLINSNLELHKRLSCNRLFLKKKKKKWAFALTLTTDNIKINKQVFPQTLIANRHSRMMCIHITLEYCIATKQMIFFGGLRVCMALKALLCSGNDESPQHWSVLRAIHTLNSPKNYIRLLEWLLPIHKLRRRGAQGLMWGTRGPFLPAGVMVSYGCVGQCWPLEANVRSTYCRNSINCLWIFFCSYICPIHSWHLTRQLNKEELDLCTLVFSWFLCPIFYGSFYICFYCI